MHDVVVEITYYSYSNVDQLTLTGVQYQGLQHY